MQTILAKKADILGIDLNGGKVSRTAEDGSNGAKHPDTVNQEMLKDRLGSTTDHCTAQTERRLSSAGCQAE